MKNNDVKIAKIARFINIELEQGYGKILNKFR